MVTLVGPNPQRIFLRSVPTLEAEGYITLYPFRFLKNQGQRSIFASPTLTEEIIIFFPMALRFKLMIKFLRNDGTRPTPPLSFLETTPTNETPKCGIS